MTGSLALGDLRTRWALIGALLAAGCALLAQIGLGSGSPMSPFVGEGEEARAQTAYAQLPLAFEQNAGQAPARFEFLARSQSGTAAIDSRGAVISVPTGKRSSEAISLRLAGAAPTAATPLERLPGEVNYMVGDDAAKWRTGLATYERVRYADVYPGIAVDWHGDQRRLEYDFRIAPGADPSRIAVRVGGAEGLRVDGTGRLVIDAGSHTVRQRAPYAYQQVGGERVKVSSAYTVDGSTVSFELGRYDRSRPLVIDPVVLAYSTYLGGSDGDAANGIAVDSTGAAYVVGDTFSSDFDTVGAIEGDQDPGQDIFIAKLTPDGSALAYSTYLGGDGYDEGRAIAVDSAGAAYVAGRTDADDFNTVGEIEGDEDGSFIPDAFIAKLTPDGSDLAYSTYLGGSDTDFANGIAVDSDGAAYVAGETDSTDFDTVGGIEGDQGSEDAFIAKLTPDGSDLAYSTYLGGSEAEVASAIAVDSQGAAYVGGMTSSADFDTVGGVEGDQPWEDAFIAKLTPDGSDLAYSTYLGGGSTDWVHAIAVDSERAAYVAGWTRSTDFDTVGAIEGDAGDLERDAFVAKLTPNGSDLAYSTYLGGNESDTANGIAVDSDGAAYVAGETASTDFDTVDEIQGDQSDEDAFIAKLTPNGSALAYSTYLGGDGPDGANAIAVDATSSAYVAGDTFSTDFVTVEPIEGNQLSTDAFITKLVTDTDLALSKSDSADPVAAGESLTYTLSAFNSGPAEAVRVTVEDPLPAGVEFISASPECSESGGLVSCELGSINRGQSETVHIQVRPSAAGTLTNTATVSAANFDPVAVNDAASEATAVEPAAEQPEQPEQPPATPAPPPLAANGTCAGQAATIVGSPGRDDIRGTPDPDVIDAKGGRDLIRSLGGEDLICARGGDDEVRAGPDADRIKGGGGTDDLRGQGGDDRIAGNRGDDRLGGGGGADRCRGGGGEDRERGC